MLRVPVDGLPVVRKTNLTWKTVCEELLGFTPPPLIPYPNENKSVQSTGLLNNLEFP